MTVPFSVQQVSLLSFLLLFSFGPIQCWFLLPNAVVESLALPRSSSQRQGSNKLLIIGLGRVGLQVADLVVENDEAVRVFGTVRPSSLRDEKKEADNNDDDKDDDDNNELVRVPFDPVAVRKHLFGCDEDVEDDDDDDDDKNEFYHSVVDAASRVLFTIPLPRETDPVMEAVLDEVREWWNLPQPNNDNANDGNDNVSDKKVLGILSTTGVYGNHDGKVVTEDSPLLCEESSNAELYRRFEDDWITLSGGGKEEREEDDDDGDGSDITNCRRLCIFRCAGIYDSSSSALHTVYKNLAALPRASSSSPVSVPTTSKSTSTVSKTNRIHSVDLARGVISGMFQNNNNNNTNPVRIYNLADNLPEERSIVLSHARELLASIDDNREVTEDANATGTITSTASTANTMSQSRSSTSRQSRRARESKLVCNKRMREELLPDDGLLFPTYREGLDAIFNDPTTPWQQQQQQQDH